MRLSSVSEVNFEAGYQGSAKDHDLATPTAYHDCPDQKRESWLGNCVIVYKPYDPEDRAYAIESFPDHSMELTNKGGLVGVSAENNVDVLLVEEWEKLILSTRPYRISAADGGVVNDIFDELYAKGKIEWSSKR